MKSRQSRVDPHFNDLSCCCFSNLCSHNKQQGIFRNLKINNNNNYNKSKLGAARHVTPCLYLCTRQFICNRCRKMIYLQCRVYIFYAVDQNLLEYCFSEKKMYSCHFCPISKTLKLDFKFLEEREAFCTQQTHG